MCQSLRSIRRAIRVESASGESDLPIVGFPIGFEAEGCVLLTSKLLWV
jgi:hypothetical protein